MPEETEIPTEHLHETIHEEAERGGALVRQVALTTALFAALGAIVALLAGSTVNEALVLKNEATTLQAQASDQWAYYQAKGIKSEMQDAIAAAWQATGRDVPPSVATTKARYAREQADSHNKAQELEKERDKKSEEAEHLLHRHHLFAGSVALLQVGIALGAVAALTRVKLTWIASCLLGVVGAALFVWAFAS